MIRTIIVFIIITCACSNLQAQVNLVRNGSFEQYTDCPTGLDQVAYAKHWRALDSPSVMTNPLDCLPDYVNACSIWGACGVPVGNFYYQYPHTGSGMMEISLYDDYEVASFAFFDYLQIRLATPLDLGQSYCVTFYLNMTNRSSYAVNNIGAYFDDGTIDTTSQCYMPQTQYTPQILETSIISDTLNWVKVQGSFIANGTEKFMTIGNFFDTSHATHIRVGGLHNGVYLIDDVSVIASNAMADAGPDVSLVIGDTASIGVAVNGDGMPCYWYVAGNSTPTDSGGTIKVHPAVNTTYVVSMDLCGTITYDTVQVNVHPDGVATMAGLQAISVSPNPASDKISINALPAATPYRLLDMRGAALLQGVCSPADNTISLSGVPSGFYLLELEATTGGKVIKKVIKE